MISLGVLSFSMPMAFAGFLVLPLVWWLVRLTPPRPQHVRFPAIRLLERVAAGRQTSHSYPWWLLVLRLIVAALLVIGAAAPVFNPQPELESDGPFLVIVDDGWAAATDWAARAGYLENLVAQADRQERGIILLTTAIPVTSATPGIMTPAESLERIRALLPKPWQTDRSQILKMLADPALALRKASRVVWLSDGLESGDDNHEVSDILARLARLGPVTFVQPDPGQEARALFPPYNDGEAMVVPVRRARPGGIDNVDIIAYDDADRAVGRAIATFVAGAVSAEARLVLPVEARNRIKQLRLDREQSAAAVVLMDERWRRRPVGLVSDGFDDDQPLLSGPYYLERALQSVTEVRSGPVNELLGRETAVMVLTDPAPLDPVDFNDLTHWIDTGGVLVVFAGPRLASVGYQATDINDSGGEARLMSLLPVTLRSGDRVIGGAMSWRRPATIAPFPPESPFQGLSIPDDVFIQRQVLAEPGPELDGRTWARLADGTPLVTAWPRNAGMVVLFHVTANAEWSNLPLSGLFVDMLQRITELSHGVAAGMESDTASGLMAPQQTLDGMGILGAPPSTAMSLTRDSFDLTAPAPRNPPGFYGTSSALRAINLAAHLDPLTTITGIPDAVLIDAYGKSGERSLAHWFFIAAAFLLGLDVLASLWLRGLMRRRSPAVGVILIMTSAICTVTPLAPALAQQSDEARTIAAADSMRLAYVITGDQQIDRISRQGLAGLTLILAQRTAVELDQPDGIDPAIDELAVYPLLYWPITDTAPLPDDDTARKINAFMANGGTVLFDVLAPGGAGNPGKLRQFATVLDIPRLVPVPGDHVLTRAFYLLNDFPGRWVGGLIWVVPADERVNDGVSPMIAGGNHWAAAWAADENQQPLYAVVPGGERQRELAYRFGVNLVMYVLTGNYKGDQVHLPIIMNRLGQ